MWAARRGDPHGLVPDPALLAITYGFLETVGLPHLSAWFTYAAVMLAWIVAQPFVARRYR